MQEQAKSVVQQQANSKDHGRMWLWGFLAFIALSQLYVVRELLAAFALFAIGFVAIALVVTSLYILQKSWELAVARLAVLRHPVINIASVRNLGSVSRENQKAA
ncbi:MAG TPA: hypothetical protein VKH63_10555 [Candidatus Acidoferrum sp.]|nr:hypothetical protein [Candidatus Acidoferrum sp.]